MGSLVRIRVKPYLSWTRTYTKIIVRLVSFHL
jgi:hypothetical protein